MKPVPMPVMHVIIVIDIGKCGSDSWQVPELCNLVKRYPEMKFVACHLLAPSNKDKDRLRWALEQLQLPNLWFDLSSVVHNCRPDEYPYPKAIEFIQLAKEMVGAEKADVWHRFSIGTERGCIWSLCWLYMLTRPCSQIRKKNRFFMKMLMECILIIIDAEGRKQK